MSNQYTSENIKVLDDISHIISRKSMYIGEADNPHHLFSEAFDNAMDELQCGYGDKIRVEIDTKNNRYIIIDNGRGIPHGTKKLEDGKEVEVLKLICTKSNSGGKFDKGAYLTSAGLHGLGLTIINALSTYMVLSSSRDGKFELYDAHADEFKSGPDESHGTMIIFVPNPKHFHSAVIPQSFIIDKCRMANAIGIHTELEIDHQTINVDATMQDLYPVEEEINTYMQYPHIYSSRERTEERISAFMKYTSDTKDKYYGYTNLLFNPIGGTHVNYISKLIIEAWEEYITSSKIKTEVPLKKSDYLVGLRCICMVFLSEPEFSSQTKEKLSAPKEMFDKFTIPMKKQIVTMLKFHDKQSRALIKRFEEYRISQNKLLARKEISSLIKVNDDAPNSIRRRAVVDKLVECTSKSVAGTELYICEGDSAGGPASRTRDKEFQAVLPLRGKILNITGLELSKILKSQEVCNIVNAIGCGIGANCDSSKSRYEKIIINADADEDALHIICLVVSVFVNLLADVVKDGRLYVAEPPLYGWSDKKGNHFTNDRNEIPEGVHIKRYKGLGSYNDKDFYIACMDPNSRKLVQIDYPSDIDTFNKILGTASGKASLLKDLGIVRDERTIITDED